MFDHANVLTVRNESGLPHLATRKQFRILRDSEVKFFFTCKFFRKDLISISMQNMFICSKSSGFFFGQVQKYVTVLPQRELLNAPLSGEQEGVLPQRYYLRSLLRKKKGIFRCSFPETSRRRVTIQMPSKRNSRIFRLVSVFQVCRRQPFQNIRAFILW